MPVSKKKRASSHNKCCRSYGPDATSSTPCKALGQCHFGQELSCAHDKVERAPAVTTRARTCTRRASGALGGAAGAGPRHTQTWRQLLRNAAVPQGCPALWGGGEEG